MILPRDKIKRDRSVDCWRIPEKEKRVLKMKKLVALHTTEIVIDFIKLENFGYLRKNYFG